MEPFRQAFALSSYRDAVEHACEQARFEGGHFPILVNWVLDNKWGLLDLVPLGEACALVPAVLPACMLGEVPIGVIAFGASIQQADKCYQSGHTVEAAIILYTAKLSLEGEGLFNELRDIGFFTIQIITAERC